MEVCSFLRYARQCPAPGSPPRCRQAARAAAPPPGGQGSRAAARRPGQPLPHANADPPALPLLQAGVQYLHPSCVIVALGCEMIVIDFLLCGVKKK